MIGHPKYPIAEGEARTQGLLNAFGARDLPHLHRMIEDDPEKYIVVGNIVFSPSQYWGYVRDSEAKIRWVADAIRAAFLDVGNTPNELDSDGCEDVARAAIKAVASYRRL